MVAACGKERYDQCRVLEHRDLEGVVVADQGELRAAGTSKIMQALQDRVAYYRDFDDDNQQFFAELETKRYRGPDA